MKIGATNKYLCQELSKFMQGRTRMLCHFIKSSLVHQRIAQTIWDMESKANEYITKLILKLVSTKLAKDEGGKLKLIKIQWSIFMSIFWFSCLMNIMFAYAYGRWLLNF